MSSLKSVITTSVRIDGTIIESKALSETLKQFAGKSIDITIEKVKKKRSLAQNRVWHGLVVEPVRIGLQETGNFWSHERVHEFLKFKFLRCWRTNEKDGTQFEDIKGTSECSTTEFEDLRLEVKEWSLDFLGIILQDPDPDYFMNLRKAKQGIGID